MAVEPIGIGVIGFGWMGKAHTYAHRSLPFYFHNAVPTRLVGVCVRRSEAVEPAVALGGFAFGTTRLEELLARPDVHAVHVCTPNALHADQCIAAIEAGKHVYCDKPLTRTADECRRILSALPRSLRPIVTRVAYQYRFYPAVERARQLIEEGRLGRVMSFRVCYLHASLVDPRRPAGWRQEEGQSGGTLHDIGSHAFDMLTHLLGRIGSVQADTQIWTRRRPSKATGRPIDITVDDAALVLVRLACGAAGVVEVSKIATGAHDDFRVEIHGEGGALRFNLSEPNMLELFEQADPDEPFGGTSGYKRIMAMGRSSGAGVTFPTKVNVGWPHAHIASVHAFLRAIAGDADPGPGFADSLHVQQVIDACVQSAAGGQRVHL